MNVPPIAPATNNRASAAGDQGRPVSAMLVLSEVRLVRDTLVDALGRAFCLADIHGVSTVEEAIARMGIVRPALVLIDVTLRGGLTAARRLRQRDQTSRLIAFNMGDLAASIATWTKAGIDSHFGRSLTVVEIVEGIETLMNNHAAMYRPTEASPAGDAAPTTNRSVGSAYGAAAILTAREEEVVRLIIDGQSNKDIARALCISVATVKSHVHNVLSKLALAGRGKVALRFGVGQRQDLPHWRLQR